MGVLSGSDLLGLWEQAAGLDAAQRALVLASAWDPSITAGELASRPIGARDARLLGLRAAVAGDRLEATAACPSCGEVVEFVLDAEVLLKAHHRDGEADHDDLPEQHTTHAGGVTVTWRCLTPADLDAVSDLASNAVADAVPNAAEAVLLERCILSVTDAGGAPTALPASARQALPAAVRRRVTEAMAEADPLAEVLVDLTCECGDAFRADVDIAEFTWLELRAAAHRLLREVAVLGGAYGWTETDVLALSDARRNAYLELALERS